VETPLGGGKLKERKSDRKRPGKGRSSSLGWRERPGGKQCVENWVWVLRRRILCKQTATRTMNQTDVTFHALSVRAFIWFTPS